MLRTIIITSLVILIPLGAIAEELKPLKPITPARSTSSESVKPADKPTFMDTIRGWFKDDQRVVAPEEEEQPTAEPAVIVPERMRTMQKLEPGPSIQEMLPLAGNRQMIRNIEQNCCSGTGISGMKIKAQQVWDVDAFPFENKTATGTQRGDFKQIIMLQWQEGNTLYQSILNKIVIDFKFLENDPPEFKKHAIAVARYAETCPLDSNMALFDNIFTTTNENYIQNVNLGAVHPSQICGGITVQLPGGTPTIVPGQANTQSHTWPGAADVLHSPDPENLTNADHLVLYLGDNIEPVYNISTSEVCPAGQIRLMMLEYGSYPAGRRFFEFIDPDPYIMAFKYDGTMFPSRLFYDYRTYDTPVPYKQFVRMCIDQ